MLAKMCWTAVLDEGIDVAFFMDVCLQSNPEAINHHNWLIYIGDPA